MIDFDVILNKIGPLGRYQIFLVSITYWLGVPSGMHNIASVFYAAQVDFRCNAPPLDNSSIYPDLTEAQILNFTTPDDGQGNPDGCRRYGYDLDECVAPSLSCVDTSAASIKCDRGYHYSTDVFTSTTNTEWDLVCDRSIWSTVATSLYFGGMWTGAIVFGYMADKIGRRYTLLFTSIGSVIAGVATGLSPWFELFVFLRFLTAAFSHAAFLFMFVYVVEITGEKRNITGIHTHSAFAAGYAMSSLISYFLRGWRGFYIAVSLTTVPYFLIHFFVPESPRWYFSNGREEEGKRLSEYFAKRNGKTLTEQDWIEATVMEEEEKDDESQLEKRRSYSSKDLFRTKRMRWITINMMFAWFATSLVYYGLSLNAGALSGDIWLNNALNGFIEILAYFFVQFTMDRLGRRLLLSSMFLLQGLSCLTSTVLTELSDGNQAMDTTAVVFAFVGKAGVAACFSIVYNYCAELFPTVVRGNALGVSSMASRWGSIMSPYIIYLQDAVSWLPFTIFGIVAILAAAASFRNLPETCGVPMTQTIEEAERFYAGAAASTSRQRGGRSPMINKKKMSERSHGKENEAFEGKETGFTRM